MKIRGRTKDRIVSCLPGLRKRTTIQPKAAPILPEIIPIASLPTLPLVTGLHSLPTELFSEVEKALPVSSRLSLSYTCKGFRSYFLDSGLSNETLPKPEQWTFLCMLERDRHQCYFRQPASKALCAMCRSRHAVRFFSPDQLPRDPNERQCLGSEGRLWICPHTAVSCALSVHSDRRLRGWGPTQCDDLYHKVYITGSVIMLERAIFTSNEASPISHAEVADALGKLEYSICPHLQMNDLSIQTLDDPRRSCLENTFDRFGCFCSKCCKPPQSPQCAFCNLTVGFRVRVIAGTDNQRIFYLRVRRNLVPSYKATDPDWLAQIWKPSEIRPLNEQWKACDAKVNEQIQSSLVPKYSNICRSTIWGFDTGGLLQAGDHENEQARWSSS